MNDDKAKHEPHPAIAELEKNHRQAGEFILIGNGSVIKVEPTILEEDKIRGKEEVNVG